MDHLSNRTVTMLAVVIAGVTGAVAEICLALGLAQGRFPPPGYLVLCVVLTMASALVVGGVFALAIPRIRWALAAWVAANAVAGLAGFTEHVAASALGMALATFLVRTRDPAGRPRPVSSGILIGLAIPVTVVVWSRTFQMLGIPRPDGIEWELSFVGAFLGIVLLHRGYGWLRDRMRWLPPDAVVGVTVFVIVAGLVPISRKATRVMEGDVSSTASSPVAAGRPSVIVLLLDTVRADHLSVYGYDRDTTPFLQRFVARNPQAAVYKLAFAPAPWTLPSHASLFTGHLPSVHGANAQRQGDLQLSLKAKDEIRALRTLAEVMREVGYRTGAFFANPQLALYRGLARGFESYVKPPARRRLFLIGEGLRGALWPSYFADVLKPYPPAAEINREILAFLDRCGDQPAFVFANYMEAHAPYAAPKPSLGTFSQGRPVLRVSRDDSAEDFRDAKDRYDEEILGLDAKLGELFEELERRGILERAWIIVTSDHGEEFAEHGSAGHGSDLYNEQMRIPLIIRPADGQEITATDGPVGLLDVTATIAAIAGATIPGSGRDLRSAELSPRPVQMEFFGNPDAREARRLGPRAALPGRAVVDGRLKLIDHGEERELYQLDHDPAERSDIAKTAPGDVERLTGLLPPLTLDDSPADSRPLTVEEQEALRALGYTD